MMPVAKPGSFRKVPPSGHFSTGFGSFYLSGQRMNTSNHCIRPWEYARRIHTAAGRLSSLLFFSIATKSLLFRGLHCAIKPRTSTTNILPLTTAKARSELPSSSTNIFISLTCGRNMNDESESEHRMLSGKQADIWSTHSVRGCERFLIDQTLRVNNHLQSCAVMALHPPHQTLPRYAGQSSRSILWLTIPRILLVVMWS